MFRKRIVAAVATAILGAATAAQPASAAATVPTFDHVVLVMFENESSTSIDSTTAPYFASLAAQGANFTDSHALTHPSQPNYVALFSGDTQGVTDDTCPQNLGAVDNLGSQLAGAGKTFTGYSESMPSDGYTGCSSGEYRRKHNSWVDFSNVPASSNLRYSQFPTDYSQLPSVSFVTPNMCNDMHDCSVGTGDTWLKNNLDGYAQWAKTHNSLLIVTFDEDEGTSTNQIYTSFTGAHVKQGDYSETINHYTVLRTMEAANGLPGIGNAANETPITDAWQ